MARAAKAVTNTKPAALRKAPAKGAKPSAAAKRAPVATPAGLKLSKDALRAEVEKLERANTILRAKGKEANCAAKASGARIAELEAQVAALEQKAASSPAPAKRSLVPPKPPRASRQRRVPWPRSLPGSMRR